MLEIEVKHRLDAPAAFRARAAALADGPAASERQEDTYFAAPDRDFARTDEAFRLRMRTIGAGPAVAELTYKGPRLDGAAKTRVEIELPIAAVDADTARALALALGYRPALVVRKTREHWPILRAGRRFEACLDLVEGLPPHAELETLAPPEDLAAARAALAGLAAELGLDGPSEPRSYLAMLLEAAGR